MTTQYDKLDIRNLPTYPMADAARYLSIPIGTLRSWFHGRYYPVEEGRRYFEPLIQRPNITTPQLSFTNLIEAHVLRVIRQVHGVRLDKVRTALDYINQRFNIPHPLSRIEFQTDGIYLFIYLFIESVGRLINVSEHGQLVMHTVLKHLLERIEWDENGIATRLFPVTRMKDQDDPKVLVIDPRISFGHPVLIGTGIPTTILAERYKTGESMDALAEDYGCDRLQIEEAIRCELLLQQVA